MMILQMKEAQTYAVRYAIILIIVLSDFPSSACKYCFLFTRCCQMQVVCSRTPV